MRKPDGACDRWSRELSITAMQAIPLGARSTGLNPVRQLSLLNRALSMYHHCHTSSPTTTLYNILPNFLIANTHMKHPTELVKWPGVSKQQLGFLWVCGCSADMLPTASFRLPAS